MKKVMTTAAVLVALIAPVQAYTEAHPHSENYCSVLDPTGTPLNVRASPNGTILGALNNGTEVRVGNTHSGRWVYVIPSVNGKAGWVLADHLACEW